MARAPRSLADEIAVRHRSIDFAGLANYLPNPDPVLKKQGRDVSVYRDLLTDDRVAGSWANRKGATLSLEWELHREVKTADSPPERIIGELFRERLDIQRIMGEILQCRLYGYQPMEIIWERRDGLILPRDVVAKPQEWFIFGTDNALRFRSRSSGPAGEELPPRSFLCPTSDASYANPYGQGLLSSCFWPVTFKKGGWRFWVQFAEKYGQAFAVGKIRRGATKEEMDDLSAMLEQMIQDAIAVIPDDSSVELVDVAGKGASSELFRDIIAEANTAISTVILGHAGAGQSTTGKLGGEDAARDVRDDIRGADKKLVCAAINQLIRWIGELNWGTADLPTFRLWEEEDVDLAQAERDEKLSRALSASGLRLSRAYYEEAYNLRPEHLEEAGLGTREAGTSFAEPANDFAGPRSPEPGPGLSDPADMIADRLGEESMTATDPWIERLRALAEQAGSLEELRDAVAAAFGDLPAAELGALMAEALSAAELAGMVEVKEEAGL